MISSEKISLVEHYITKMRGEKRVEIIGEEHIASFKSTSAFERFEVEHEVILPNGTACLRGIQFIYPQVTYNTLIAQLVRLAYQIDDELAILRQRDVKPEEFQEYNEYVEYCKLMADEYITFVDNLN